MNTIVAWWLLTTVPHICEKALLPVGSPWTCPGDHVFFDASVIWGLVGPRRIFGPLGYYNALNWCFLGGLVCPLFVWLLARAVPGHAWWISLVNLPVILGATANMPPASTLNYTAWCFVGTVFKLLRVPVPQEVVAALQLRAVGCHGRRRGHHGGGHLLRAVRAPA